LSPACKLESQPAGQAFRVRPTIYNYFGSIITSVPSTKDGDQ
jgi:hypothetical protein